MDVASWRYLFILPVALVLVALAMAGRAVPNSREQVGHRFDTVGALTSAVAVAGFIFVLQEGPNAAGVHARFGARPLDQAGRGGYVADMARIGAELGVPDPPRTHAELTARIARYRTELAGTAQAREAARFLLLTPPLPALARPPYTVLAAAAVSLLPGWARRPLHLPRLPVTETALIRPAGDALVHAIRRAITPPRPPRQLGPGPAPNQ